MHISISFSFLFFSFLTRVFLFILFIRDEHYTGKISTKLLENNEKHFSPDEIVPRIRFPPKVSFLVFLLCRSPLFSQKLSWFHLSRMMIKVYYTYIYTYTYTDSISNLSYFFSQKLTLTWTYPKLPNWNIVFSIHHNSNKSNQQKEPTNSSSRVNKLFSPIPIDRSKNSSYHPSLLPIFSFTHVNSPCDDRMAKKEARVHGWCASNEARETRGRGRGRERGRGWDTAH